MIVSRPIVVLDLETTGIWIEKDKIIEIALIRIGTDGSKESWESRVNPGIQIPPYVTKLTGITNNDVKDAPVFKNIAKEIHGFIGDADFGGFNVERFDLPLLEREFFEAGMRLEWRQRKVYDAQKIYHIHEKRDLKAAFKFYCNQDLENAHSALADTQAALSILESQVVRYGKGSMSIESLEDFEYETSSDFFDTERKFRWWNGELYPVFGKYGRRHSVRELVIKDRSYLEYLINTDFSETVKAMLRDALAGKYPTQTH